jgi:TetR/AcrR family transcriptional regulator, cholesterol catabolism regulator
MNIEQDMKQRIIDKATELFGKYGYSSIKTDQLATELGISKRTLYLHFSSKKALLETVINAVLDQIESNMESFFSKIENHKDNFIEELLSAWEINLKISSVLSEHFFTDIQKYLPQIMDSYVKRRESNLRENFDKIYDIGLQLGYFKDHIHKDILYLVHYFSLKYILNPEVLSHSSFSISEAIRQIYVITMTGALTKQGVERFDSVREKIEQMLPFYLEKV